MALPLAAFAIGGAVLGGLTSLWGQNEEQDRQNEILAQQKLAAKYTYSATESSSIIMRAIAKEQATNATVEELRVAAANSRELEQQIKVQAGKVSATNEGLTSGRSKGRQMLNVYQKGNELLYDTKAQTKSAISSIIEQKDTATNQINNAQIGAYQQLVATLQQTAPDMTNTATTVNAAVQGAMSGFSLAK